MYLHPYTLRILGNVSFKVILWKACNQNIIADND